MWKQRYVRSGQWPLKNLRKIANENNNLDNVRENRSATGFGGGGTRGLRRPRHRMTIPAWRQSRRVGFSVERGERLCEFIISPACFHQRPLHYTITNIYIYAHKVAYAGGQRFYFALLFFRCFKGLSRWRQNLRVYITHVSRIIYIYIYVYVTQTYVIPRARTDVQTLHI